MENKLEKLAKVVFKKWQAAESRGSALHPDDQTLASFMEGKLTGQEAKTLKEHLAGCDACAGSILLQVQLASKDIPVPQELIDYAKGILHEKGRHVVFEIILRFKEKAIELLSTTADVLMGQELVPAPVLRARKIKDFQDSIVIFKDFGDIRVELKIENKGSGHFNLIAMVKEIPSQNTIKDLRVTLNRDDVELESYLADSGSVIFEHVLLGKYVVEISNPSSKLASIVVDIKT